MGLIDFVKEAGEKLLGRGRGAAPASAAPAQAAPLAIDAEALQDRIQDLGLRVENLVITVRGDLVTVSGKAASQADREKTVLVLGNTRGVARVDDRLEVAAPEPAATYYTVVKGDTLSKIAKAQYGNANEYNVIFEANRPMLSDPDKIYPGQVLRIPPRA